MVMAEAKTKQGSSRLKDANSRKILDQYSRAKRLRKQLEALEQDNFQEDPHIHLNTPNKKLPQFDADEGAPTKKKRKTTRGDHFKQRFRKTFASLVEEEQMSLKEPPNYMTACIPQSKFPARKFCSVCGNPSNYTCVTCGSRYCCVRCLGTHQDTRCLKWTA
ncbi:Zinc finger HIT domain-containing protein 1 [Holothuria leucospilota]|uniref:Zinc finger HIT domain-containing protein 1 n=1 Tax=Holothuria leucospilota TaxID=206669 RepID=A0A9Q1H2U4_HOLLE|nr:Zinc finger HIT domain-containing protein 1 [Holothuria leucospilota]